ncbi:MAG: hypothetical protein ACRBF0_01555 [Calditrichia bacterium]
MKRMLLLLFPLLLASCGETDYSKYLEYQTELKETNQLVSSGFPESTITFDSSFVYVGAETFILYDIARCEIHLFVDADSNKIVNRLYWMQYEGYLPSLWPHWYEYEDEPFRTMIGGKEFYDGVNFYTVDSSRQHWSRDSDIGRVFALMESNGYTLDSEVMRIRLVHLDEEEDDELMIMYIERMSSHGLTIASFGENGRESERWKVVSQGLRERVLAGMDIEFH